MRSSTLLDLPLRLTSASDRATRRIEEAVDELQHVTPEPGSHGWYSDLLPPQMEQVDEAVSDLFRLTDAERDLVADFWSAQRKDAMRPLPGGVERVRVRQTTLTRTAGKGLSRTYGCFSASGIDDLRVRVNSAGGSGAIHGLTSLRWSSRRANSASR